VLRVCTFHVFPPSVITLYCSIVSSSSSCRPGPLYPTPDVTSDNSALDPATCNSIRSESVLLNRNFRYTLYEISPLEVTLNQFHPPLPFLTSCDHADFPMSLLSKGFPTRNSLSVCCFLFPARLQPRVSHYQINTTCHGCVTCPQFLAHLNLSRSRTIPKRCAVAPCAIYFLFSKRETQKKRRRF